MQKSEKLLWQLYTPYLFIIILSLIAVAWLATHSIKKYYLELTVSDLEAKSRLAEKLISGAFSKDGLNNIEKICVEVGRSVNTRITAINTQGLVLCDSSKEPKTMDNHAGRPEIAAALKNNVGVSTRYSDTLKQEMIYVAVPVVREGGVVGVVRSSNPFVYTMKALYMIYLESAIGGLLIALFSAVASLAIVKRIIRPLDEMKKGADRFARGDLEYRINVTGSEEMRALSEAMNKMAAQLKKLETVRRDFVANVSHELMTPITSIKGFVETLKDGAIENREKTKEFLDIISRQSDRLGAIIEDLLSLSRIEQEAEGAKINFEQENIFEVLEAAVSMCEHKADEKNVKIKIICEKNPRIPMNAALIEEAVVNLIDNAVKYSLPGAEVIAEAVKKEKEMIIRVVDHGCGIPPEHVTRIFERFYRVDKSRSRDEGGTGLGLAIVKHIVSAHAGRVEVESAPGKGSIFVIRLPISQ